MFYFHPYLGKGSNLTNIFQRGWNHQQENMKIQGYRQIKVTNIFFSPLHPMSYPFAVKMNSRAQREFFKDLLRPQQNYRKILGNYRNFRIEQIEILLLETWYGWIFWWPYEKGLQSGKQFGFTLKNCGSQVSCWWLTLCLAQSRLKWNIGSQDNATWSGLACVELNQHGRRQLNQTTSLTWLRMLWNNVILINWIILLLCSTFSLDSFFTYQL